MAPEENEWDIKMVQNRNEHLSLTSEQAGKILEYENENLISTGSFLSVWEELDYELYVYTRILDEVQSGIYKEKRNKGIEIYTSDLIKGDELAIRDLQSAQDLLKFYQDLVPTFFNDPYSFSLGWLLSEKTKINYLRAEYQNFLFNEKKRIIAHHFRHYRTFRPKTLEASLLRHKSNCLWPDFNSFIQKMDEPTIAIFKFLEQKIRISLIDKGGFLTKQLSGLQNFKEINFNKHYPDAGGWHVDIALPTDEKQKQIAMLLLLMKLEGYVY